MHAFYYRFSQELYVGSDSPYRREGAVHTGRWRSRKALLLGYFQVHPCRKELGEMTWDGEPQGCQRSLKRLPRPHQASIVPEVSYWSLFLLGLSMLSTVSFSAQQHDFAGSGTLSPSTVFVIRIPHIYLRDVIAFVPHANWLLPAP